MQTSLIYARRFCGKSPAVRDGRAWCAATARILRAPGDDGGLKGSVLRGKLRELFDQGRHSEIGNLISEGGLSESDRKNLEAVHPMFMGGNYLPDTEEGEVEIARITISSTTFDVTSVYARPDNDGIRYKVVDEYDGDTLCDDPEKFSTKPLSLNELHEYFTSVWPLNLVLQRNFNDSLQDMLKFFVGASDFYPEFDNLCRVRVTEAFGE